MPIDPIEPVKRKSADAIVSEADGTKKKSTWAKIVQGNRGVDERWKLEWIKPSGRDNSVRITHEEWDIGIGSQKTCIFLDNNLSSGIRLTL